jgi:hypothetical protein
MYREDNVRSDLANWKKFSAVACMNDGGGAATQDEIGILVAPHRMMLTAASVVAVDHAVVADPVNHVHFTINVMTAAVIRNAATQSTAVLGMAQYVPFPLTLSATIANIVIERGDLVSVVMTKDAGGVAVDEVQVTLHLKAVV